MTEERVRVLEKLYQQGQASDVVELALEKLFDYELRASRKQLVQLEQDLAGFEERHQMTSDAFYTRFQAGEIGDSMDLIEWASLFQMTQRLRERVGLLEES
jgi:hypothetical protein